jgi:Ca-activated chloride channel family protein
MLSPSRWLVALALLSALLALAACGTSKSPEPDAVSTTEAPAEVADAAPVEEGGALDEVVVEAAPPARSQAVLGAAMVRRQGIAADFAGAPAGQPMRSDLGRYAPPVDREGYAPIDEVGFRRAADVPLSTFSIDVDRASYANTRRFLTSGRLPPEDAVRVEEFVNSFDYGLEGPGDRAEHPFAVHTEVTEAPWAPDHHLVRIGLQGRRIETEALPPANLVFLIDVSGSMDAPDKLPLLQRAFRLLVRELRPEDRVALVVYAGSSGLVLEPTSGAEKGRILEAIDRLRAGGSTAGASGLRLAYETARQHFDAGATNRVILATDGDFNVGVSSDAEMKRLVEEERESGVMLSVLGFGTGNLQDSKMETLADHGNGNYAYIDSIREAERVFVREFGGTLFSIAKDVKVQVEFNPARVAGYRLVGYENRRLANEDFNDDRKDAGELGAGHTVTALYEIVPVGVEVPSAGVDDLRYQRTPALSGAADSDEWLTVALRYKPATGAGAFADESVRLAVPVAGAPTPLARASEATRWAVAVTEAALLLRNSDYAPGASWDHALALARSARGSDPHGDRAEFVRLVETAAALEATERGPEYEASVGE